MRQRRAKTYRKLLAAYIRHFGLRPPLQVLIDAPMATALAAMRLSVDDVPLRLEGVLQVSAALPSGSRPQSFAQQSTPGARGQKAALVKPMITQCCIVELYNKQKDSETGARAVELAKSWERRFCNHKSPITGDRCMAEVIGETNKHRYVLAANSPGLRARVRRTVAGVAMVHTNDHHVLVLEPMSELTRDKVDQLERQKISATGAKATGLKRVPSASDSESDAEDNVLRDGATDPQQAAPLRKKRAKEPNPLSVKKSKKDRSTADGHAVASAVAGRSGAARRKKKKLREQQQAAGLAA